MSKSTGFIQQQIARCASWPDRFTPEEWSIYKEIIERTTELGIPFAVGGGLAAMTYAGQWRNTKDLDLYILESDRNRMIELVTAAGLTDLYDEKPYDREWIYRSHTGETIVDLIWAMANRRSSVQAHWLAGPEVNAGGVRLRLLAPEEALWSKLYVLQRDRTDWPDALNLLYGIGPEIDWGRVLDEVGDDKPLLTGVLAAFAWLCPSKAIELPVWIWQQVGLSMPAQNGDANVVARRASLLDSRPWFTPTMPEYQAAGATREEKSKEEKQCSSVR